MAYEEIEQPSVSNYTLSVLGALGSLLLFLLILFIAYLPNRPEAANTDIVEQRKELLATTQAEANALSDSYEWIDQKKGTVRIPIERAKKLAVDRLNKK